MADNDARIEAVRRFAAASHYEQGHSEQVTRLAEMLFDATHALHRLDAAARFLLTCAGLLHDIGWSDGQKGHHKMSMQMILTDRTLPLTPDERAAVALIARYHRKSLPDRTHPVYCDLAEPQRKVVDTVGAILRLADGLDRSHTNAVEAIDISLGDKQVLITCQTHGPADEELHYGKTKADLFERVFNCTVQLTGGLIKP